MKYILISVISVLIAIGVTGCSYTQSAIEYAREGTTRVQAGYTAKENMTREIVEYLSEANKDCGVKVEVINGVPVTTVKQCVDLEDALRIVQNTEIVKPQAISDIADGVGNFIIKATNLAVPLAGVYYNTQLQEKQLDYNYKTTVNNNDYQLGMWDKYTGTYNNNDIQVVQQDKIQVVDPTIVTNKEVQIVEPTVVETTTNNYNAQ